tara:strand:+ start:291 stop:578 length:288 start_codon:yes stop_codon:yes gene_type:complete
MYKTKIQNLKDLEFYSAIENVASLIKKWREQSPANDELKLLENNVIEIFLWTNNMEQEHRLLTSAISEHREEKNKALNKYNELKKKYDKMKELEL